MLRQLFIKSLNSLFPEIYLTLPLGISILSLPDAFDAIEENLAYNFYFNRDEMLQADTILDLGAHIGTFSIYTIISAKKGAKLIAVEPAKQNYVMLLRNLKLFRELIAKKKLRIYALNKAVWHRGGKVKLSLSAWSETHYVSEESGGEEVEAVTLDELLDLAEGVTLVKMDIEGAETRVLKEARKLNKVSAISAEVHSSTEEIEEVLRSNCFNAQLFRYPVGPDLAHYWMKSKPKTYSLLIATYRLIVSNIAKPTITIVKGIKE